MLKILKTVFLTQWVSPRRIKNGAALRENPRNRDIHRQYLYSKLRDLGIGPIRRLA